MYVERVAIFLRVSIYILHKFSEIFWISFKKKLGVYHLVGEAFE